jgi:hypothetical protein
VTTDIKEITTTEIMSTIDTKTEGNGTMTAETDRIITGIEIIKTKEITKETDEKEAEIKNEV